MKTALTAAALAMLLTAPAFLRAQIYTCTAPDGTKIFADHRCGADAKVVPGISTGGIRKRSPATKSDDAAPKLAPKSEAELQALSERCDQGDAKACNEWTRGGGPASLKADERKLEQSCTAGELAACEERYCRDGATRDCRAKVKETAPASGANWYMRTTGKRQADGTTDYAVRCMPEGDLAIKEAVVSCAAKAGPERCSTGQNGLHAATMSEAAAKQCTGKH